MLSGTKNKWFRVGKGKRAKTFACKGHMVGKKGHKHPVVSCHLAKRPKKHGGVSTSRNPRLNPGGTTVGGLRRRRRHARR